VRSPTSALTEHPLEAVRDAAAWVASRAEFVRIDEPALQDYAASLPLEQIQATGVTLFPALDHDPEALCAFVLQLDAVNFGSGYFPWLHKLPGRSGYRTIEARLAERFEVGGPLQPRELEELDAAACAELFGQDLEAPARAELMELFAGALRDLGRCVRERFGGGFSALVRAAGRSAESLVRILLEMELYRDVAEYRGRQIPFFKRAQLTAADLELALPEDLGRFADLDRLTIFADNLVPHVLRLDGVLRFDTALVERIQRQELIPPGSPEEVEIRACALHAVERIAALLEGITPRQLDYWLWSRGGLPGYKAHPRHRTRCTFY
jgi:hypothetical protein